MAKEIIEHLFTPEGAVIVASISILGTAIVLKYDGVNIDWGNKTVQMVNRERVEIAE